jgi:ParB family chromosome partitioning protein
MSEETEILINRLKSEEIHFINEAEIYQEIIKLGYSQTELGMQLNKTQPTIGNKLRLLNLSQACRNMVIANNLTERHARTLLKIQSEEERFKVLTHVINNGLTVKKMECFVSNNYRYQLEAKNEIKEDLNLLFSSVRNEIKMMIRKGIKVKAKKYPKKEYTDILIRVYK